MIKLRITVFSIILITVLSGRLFGQEISIANISPFKGFLNDNVEISGSGFSSTSSNLEVWFGGAMGSIVSSSNNFIIASVPIGCTPSVITVTNKLTGLSASSSAIFHKIYQGESNPDLVSLDFYSFSNTQELFDLVMVDLDKDGKNDILASKIDAGALTVVAYRNTSNGSNIDFVEQVISVGSPTSKIAAGDIDGDGKQDIIVGRAGNIRDQIYVLKNTSTSGNITFAPKVTYQLKPSQFAQKIHIQDMDLDGKPDVVVANASDDEVSIFRNISTIGNLVLNTVPDIVNTGAATGNNLVIQDFNNDGKHDLALTQFVSEDVVILPNISSSGALQFGSPITLSINSTLNAIEAGDLNEDGKIDLALTDPFNNELIIFINQSTDVISFGTPQVFPTEPGGNTLKLVDFVGNGRLDIIVSSSNTDNMTLYENTSSTGTLAITKKLIAQTNRSIGIVGGDMSNDAKTDLIYTAKDVSSSNYFLMAIRNNTCLSPAILGDANPQICNGQTYTPETAPATGTNFVWKKDGIEVINSLDPFYDATLPGSYTVTAETEGGACSVESIAVILTLNTGSIPVDPTASNNGPTCIDGSITLSSTTISGASYLWTGPNGFSSTDQNPIINNIGAVSAGTYSVVATLSPCESNSSETIVEVINPPGISVSISGNSNLCDSEAAVLTVGSASGYSYQWYRDNVIISGATNNTYSATDAGSYTVNLQGVSNNCDLTSEPTVITTFPPATPIFNYTGTTCSGSVINFTESTVIESNQTPSYSWDINDDGLEDYNIANPSHTYTAAGTYKVTLTIAYLGHTCVGVPTSQDIIISDPTAFTIEVVGSLPFCVGDSVQLSVPATGFSSALWSTGETGLSIYAKSAGVISVDATNSIGCVSTNNITISTLSAPTILITAESETIGLGQSTQLEATGADTFSWSPIEGLDNASISNPIASPQATTIYQVEGTDLAGCIGVAEITINVEDSGDTLPVEVPKMFSPDNNGFDDTWTITNIQTFPECEVVIFSRNGAIVFTGLPYSNTPGDQTNWDGTDQSGNLLPEGAYFYTISCPDGKNASGSVSIIKVK